MQSKALSKPVSSFHAHYMIFIQPYFLSIFSVLIISEHFGLKPFKNVIEPFII